MEIKLIVIEQAHTVAVPSTLRQRASSSKIEKRAYSNLGGALVSFPAHKTAGAARPGKNE